MSGTQLGTEPQAAGVLTQEGSDFASLLKREFKPKSDRAREAVEAAVQTLAQQALANTALVSSEALVSIEAMIAAIDAKLTEQINLIMHHEDFQQLESGWRGLHYLVNNTETDEMLKIKVLNVSKKDLAKTLKKFRGTAWDQSPIFKKIYEEEYGQFGGEPFGLLVGDYYFDHSPVRHAAAGRHRADRSRRARAVHRCRRAVGNADGKLERAVQPARPDQDLPDAGICRLALASGERRFSRYIGLAMPRYLSRLPYGAKTEPVDEFAFEEDTTGADSEQLHLVRTPPTPWPPTSPARSRPTAGPPSIRGIESGGAVEGLPTHTFPTDDGGVAMQCPTEIAISDRREAELAKNGLHAVDPQEEQRISRPSSAHSRCKSPTEYDDPAATANANLSARLPYLFASCRFAHYLKCMVRDKIGGIQDARTSCRPGWQNWLMLYIDGSPNSSSGCLQGQSSAGSEGQRRELEARTSPIRATTAPRSSCKPHYQLEGHHRVAAPRLAECRSDREGAV